MPDADPHPPAEWRRRNCFPLGAQEGKRPRSQPGGGRGPGGREGAGSRAPGARPGRSARPTAGRRRLPFPSRPSSQRRPKQKEPRRPRHGRRPASPGLARATLADGEDLQRSQHVLVHPDPAPRPPGRAGPTFSTLRGGAARACAAPSPAAASFLSHRVFRLQEPGTPQIRLDVALRLRKPRVPGVFPEGKPSLAQAQKERAGCDFTYLAGSCASSAIA